ncbi:MAG: NAD-dependent succinate-semialdehyde dehydrogenase [Amphritea sp.]
MTMFKKIDDLTLLVEQAYIDGQWVDAADGSTLEVTNPANGNWIGRVPNMGARETSQAIKAANCAFPVWRAKTAAERARILRRWKELILIHQVDLALLITREQGKPLHESCAEISFAASLVEWFAEEAIRVYESNIFENQLDKRILTTREPIGVCAVVTSWNFPASMVVRKAGSALAAGCSIVLKPSSQTPFSAIALCKLAEEAGIPKGVFNLVTGDAKAIAGELAANQRVRKLTFSGSAEVGKKLMEKCVDSVKKVSLELGGNAPFIVFEDADLDQAVAGVLAAKFRNAGQASVCANRILVQDSVYDTFAEKLVAAVNQLQVGDGMEPGVDLGPLIDMATLEKVEDHVEDALAKGAQRLSGGQRDPLGGSFFQPTVLGNVTSEMLVTYEETFGPVAPLFQFKDEAEAISMANDTEYGLAAYIFSSDISCIRRVSEALESGIVGINTGTIDSEKVPFGGIKESGISNDGSKYGIDDFLNVKYLCVGGAGRGIAG